MEETINLLLCCDNNCFDGLLFTLLSTANNTEHPLRVFIATGHFKTKKKEFFKLEDRKAEFIGKILKEKNPDSSVTLVDLTDETMKVFGKSKNFHGNFSPFALLRILSDFHPEFGDKLLYIDIDLIVTGDIYKVFSYPLDGNDIGMVRDEVGSHWLGKNYCNSGVLLMDLKLLRENHHFDKVRYKVIHNRYFMPDQTALNRALKSTKKIMSPRFNDQHYLYPDTIIRHYCQWIKFSKGWWRNVAEKPWKIEKFKNVYGPDTHKEIFDEFLHVKDTFLKENREK